MKIKNGFIMRSINNVNVVVPVGESAGFSAMITLNGSGAFLWKLLETDTTTENLVAQLLQKYDIDESTAKKDVAAFVEKARSAGILEE